MRDDDFDYKQMKRAQIAAYGAASQVSKDYTLVSVAFLELALIIKIATRSPRLTKLEHRDRVLSAVHALHDELWDDTSDLHEKIRGDGDE